MKKFLFRILSLFSVAVMSVNVLASCNKTSEEIIPESTVESDINPINQNITPFTNPISSRDAADPFMTYDSETGYYYALFTLSNRIELFRSRYAGDILREDSRVVYEVNPADSIYGSIWAAEMHKGTDGKWYIYTSGQTDPQRGEKHLFVLQAEGDDPFGNWSFKGIMMPELFCIDPTVYTTILGRQYICYSRVDEEYGQVLELCEMINPYTCSDRRTTIARAELDWELVEPYTGKRAIVEGAFFLERNGRFFIIYSANGCWSDNYCLGILEYTGGDIMNAENWKKHPEPLLTMGNGVYGPGHASFFKSPDGSEVWCAYHGMLKSNKTSTPAKRCLNLQRVEFTSDGFPIIGQPVGYETAILPPDGEEKTENSHNHLQIGDKKFFK